MGCDISMGYNNIHEDISLNEIEGLDYTSYLQLPYPLTEQQEAGVKKVIVPGTEFTSTPFSTPCSAAMKARLREAQDGGKSDDG